MDRPGLHSDRILRRICVSNLFVYCWPMRVLWSGSEELLQISVRVWVPSYRADSFLQRLNHPFHLQTSICATISTWANLIHPPFCRLRRPATCSPTHPRKLQRLVWTSRNKFQSRWCWSSEASCCFGCPIHWLVQTTRTFLAIHCESSFSK